MLKIQDKPIIKKYTAYSFDDIISYRKGDEMSFKFLDYTVRIEPQYLSVNGSSLKIGTEDYLIISETNVIERCTKSMLDVYFEIIN